MPPGQRAVRGNIRVGVGGGDSGAFCILAILLRWVACYSIVMTTIAMQDIRLKPAQIRALEKKARDEGVTPPGYIRLMIERDLLAEKTFDEILRPIRDDVRRKGLTEEELDGIVDRARRARSRKAGESRT